MNLFILINLIFNFEFSNFKNSKNLSILQNILRRAGNVMRRAGNVLF